MKPGVPTVVTEPVRRAVVARGGEVDDVVVAVVVAGARTTVGAARLAAAPARLALRTPVLGMAVRRRIDTAALQGRNVRLALRIRLDELADGAPLAGPLREALDRLFAGPLPEVVGDALVEHRVVQRILARVLADPELQETLSAELKAAMAQQGTTFAGEVGDGLRGRTESLDTALERTLRGWLRRPRQAEP
jgi:hypothetical protein